MSIEHLPLKSIRTDLGTQMRLETNEKVVEEYRVFLDDLPPVTVFLIDGEYVLVDGFHRYAAFERNGRDTIPCEIKEGTLDDAMEYACCANKAHGLRRDDDDKRKAVETFFAIPGRDTLNNSEVSRRVGVSVPFVKKVREELGVKPSPASHHGAGSEKRRLNDLNLASTESSVQEGEAGLNDLIPSTTQNGDKTINVDLPSKDAHQFAVTLLRHGFDVDYLKSCAENILEQFNP